MLVILPTGWFIIAFIITSLICVNYINSFEKLSSSRNCVVLLVLVVAQLLLSIPFVIIYVWLLTLFTPPWSWGGSGLYTDLIIVPVFFFAHTWALLVVNFTYLIWAKPTMAK